MTDPRASLSPEEKRELLARLLEKKAARPQRFPLSFAQQRLWFLDQLDPGSPAYNIWAVSRLGGSTRPSFLEAGLREIVRRHQTLRTTFTLVDGEPVQVVGADASLSLPVVDLGALPAAAREGELRRLVTTVAHLPFDLGRGPLLRVVLLQLSRDPEQGESVLALALHHIIADGWSLGLLVRELTALYPALAAGGPSPLPPLPLQYTDFVLWQRQWLQGELLDEQLAFWKDSLRNASPVLELPVDRPRPPVQSFRGASHSFVLPRELQGAVQSLARREGLTLFMTLLASFQILLHRYTNQDDISVGSPIAGRDRKEVAGLIGFFANTLVLGTDLSGQPSVRELLGRVRGRVLGALAHQDMPFEKLVEALQPQRDPSRTPLIQVAFAIQIALDGDLALPGADPLAGERQTSKVDLTLELAETAGGLSGIFEYCRDLFDRATIQRLARHFGHLLEALSGPDALEKPIGELSLLADWERAQILTEWGKGRLSELPALLHEQVARQAALRPDALALQGGGESMTYRELEARSNQLARHLRRLGARAGVPVALALDRSSIQATVGFLSILKAGAAYLPLDPAHPAERLRSILEQAFSGGGTALLLTDRAKADLFPGVHPIFVDADREAIAAEGTEPLGGGPFPESLAYVIFTSGSTGTPKGVAVTHAGLANLTAAQLRLFGIGPGDRVLQFAPLSFDVSVWEIAMTLAHGATLCTAPVHDLLPGPGLIRCLRDLRITLATLPPSVLAALPEGEFPDFHTLLVGGEAWPLALARRWARRMRVFNGYGPTEATAASSAALITADEDRMSFGRPFENVEYYVVDPRLEPVPPGVAGELFIAGIGLARGYLGRPDLTAAAFLPHPFSQMPGARWYRTGDLVRHLSDGRVEYLGRLGHQVKIRGFRIELEEIEAVLARHPSVRSAAVVIHEDRGERSLVACVVTAGEAAPAGEIRDFLRERLPEYMVPARIVGVPALPLGAHGKVDRRALLALIPDHAGRGDGGDGGDEGGAEPASDLERTIAGIWREVLGVEQVGVGSNFFDLGGHSLRLVTVHARLQQALDREIPIVVLFQHPTIGALARHLEPEGPSRAAEDLRAVIERAGGRGRREEHGGEERSGFAVIGLAGRFPGAADPGQLWENLRRGVESVSVLSDEDLRAAGVDEARIASPNYVKAAPLLDGVDLFDADLFGFNPREAEMLDPQQRLFLEHGWQVLENAGYDPLRFRGPIGVYAGAQTSSYVFNLLTHPEILDTLGLSAVQAGVEKDFLAPRLSYALNLKGPSVAVQTACSTSLVAVHLACQALAAGDCDIALAGGVTVHVPQREGYLYIDGGLNSPDGHCRAFDAGARGAVFGSGVGLVALKRLDDALRDGDTIHAVIRGTAINNDGAVKVGFAAPSVEGQAQVIAAAQAAAGVSPDSISYVEAHGTGTVLGDPIEVAALTSAFRAGTDRTGFCALGSVKTNVGHLDAAAGIAGLLKTVLALRHRQIPPSLHFERPNPKIDFASSPFYVAARLEDWPAPQGGAPRRAGVSAFGVGGTNAHVVLEEAPEPEPSGPSRPHQLLLLSARTPEALDEATARLAAHLSRTSHAAGDGSPCLADVAYTLQVGRQQLEHRRVLVCNHVEDAVAALEAHDPARLLSGRSPSGRRSLVFVFPDRGIDGGIDGETARAFYDTEPVFREALDAVAERLSPRLGRDLRDLLLSPSAELSPRFAQPALFAVQHSLAQLWLSWGIVPWTAVGHGLGELAAACLNGALGFEEALDLVSSTDPGPAAPTGWTREPAESIARRLAKAPGGNPIMQEVIPSTPGGAGLLEALGRLWLAGVEIDWQGFSAHERRQRVPLPTYPFQRRRFWIERRAWLPTAAVTATAAVQAVDEARPVRPAPTAFAGHSRPYLTAPFVAPRDEEETLLAEMWHRLLGIHPIGAHDDFFELGGHSLLATQVLSRIPEALQVEIGWDAFFAGPTVAGLAEQVRAARRSRASTSSAPETAAAPPLIQPVPRDGDLPLSFAQERLWFLDQLEPGSTAYNIPSPFTLRGRLDLSAFARALSETVRRHESLRTTLEMTPAGQGVQRIAPSRAIVPPSVDLRGLSEAARRQEALRLARAEERLPFNLSQGPLLRVVRLALADEESLVLATMHHTVGDGWSIGVMVGEIATLYTAFAAGRPSPLPELPIQYADFAAWQRKWLSGGVLEAELAWWRERLQDVPVLEMPTDRPRPATPTFRGRSLAFRISPQLTSDLHAHSRRQGGTLFMSALAAFEILLASHSGQDDFAVGTPIAGRNHRRTEELIGFFVNTLVLRADLSADPSLRELLARAREASLGAYAHQDLPFEKIVEELKPERSLSHSPLFQVLLVLQNAPVGRQELPGLTLEPFAPESDTARFELSLSLTEDEGGVNGLLEYNTALFDGATARRLADHLTTVMEAMTADPERRLSDLVLWSEAEREQALREWKDAAREPEWEAPVHELFADWAARTPDADALVFEGETVSYGELNRRVDGLADRLHALGVGPETLVALCLEPSPEMIVALLAVLKAGGAYVPLDPGYPADRLLHMLEDSRADVLLTRERFRSVAGRAELRVVCLDEGEVTNGNEPGLPVAPGWSALPGSAAYVIYTSGSTGSPKGVVALHGGLMSFTRSMAGLLGLGPGDRMLQFASLSFDASAVQIFPTLTSGAALVLHPDPRRLAPLELLDLCARERVTVLDLPAALWRQWVAEVAGSDATDATDATEARIAAPIRMYLTGGESVPAVVLRDWESRMEPGTGFLSSYGPTEATITTTAFRIKAGEVEHLRHAEVPLGEPLANVRIHLLSAALQPVPQGAAGEVCIGGTGVTRGYLRQPALTAERFLPDPWASAPGSRLYRTGDLARRRADGTLQFLGRRDHQVKLRGHRIELGEVEAALALCPGVRECAVIVDESGTGDRRLVAFVVSEALEALEVLEAVERDHLTPEAIQERLRASLPEAMVPSFVIPLPELPLSPTGKVDRRALARMALGLDLATLFQGQRQGRDRIPPRTKLETELVEIWEELLEVKPIGIRDSFFEVGGHSLLAVRLMAQLRLRLGRDLPLAVLFEEPTVEHMARRLDGGEATGWSSLVALSSHPGTSLPFFCVHPIGGEVVGFYPLAQHLAASRSFYGLQAPSLTDPRATANTTIEQMAAGYLEEVRKLQAHGPYLLGGLSFGGVIAFEMAQQLVRAGEDVAIVALLDTSVTPGNDGPLEVDRAAFIAGLSREQARQRGLELALTAEDLHGLDTDAQLTTALDVLRRAGVVGDEIDVPLFRHFIDGYMVRREAVERYKSRPYPGRLAMFRSSEVDPELLRSSTAEWQMSFEDPTFGWGVLAAGGVQVHRVPGYHETMVAEPHVAVLARVLQSCLAEAEENHTDPGRLEPAHGRALAALS